MPRSTTSPSTTAERCASSPTGVNLNLKHGTFTDITIENSSFASDGTGSATGAAVAIDGRNDAPSYNSNPASISGVTLSNLTFTGTSPIDLSIGDNVTGVSFSGVSLGGTGVGLVNFVTAADTLSIANTDFAASLAGYIINSSPNKVLATSATFGPVGPADNTLADLYAVEDKIADAIDVSGFGLVRLRAGNVYVTPNSFFPLGGTTTPSIQRGVDAASSGDTVHVEAGTYSGEISIDKSLSLQGAEAGVDPGATGWGVLPISEILGLGINAPIQIESGVNNVTISGFDIESPAGGSGALNAGIWMNGSSGITIEDNVLQNNTVGVAIADAGGSINNNLIQNNNAPGAGGGNGVEFFGGSSGVWSIAHNHFTGNSSADILIATGGPSVSNVTISNNALTSSGGIDLFNTDGALVFENSASAMQGPAVYLGGDDSNIEVSQNDLSNNPGRAAVMVDNSFAVGTNSDISIHNNFLDTNALGVDVTAGSLTGSMTVVDNHIQGNTTAGLENDSTGTVNADFNWWGDPSGPTNAANPGGTGDKIIDPTASFSRLAHQRRRYAGRSWRRFPAWSWHVGWHHGTVERHGGRHLHTQSDAVVRYHELGHQLGRRHDGHARH